MEKHRKSIYLVLLISVLMVFIILSTYAFFNKNVSINDNLLFNTLTSGKSIFTAYSEGNIALNIGFNQMAQANVSTNVAATNNSTITVRLDNESDNDTISCTYDLVWVWDSSDKYTKSDIDLPYTKDDTIYPYELSSKIDGADEKDLSNLTWTEADGKTEGIIVSKEIRITGRGSITNTHQVDVQVYNIPVDQKNLFGKSFKAHIEVKNNKCTSNKREFQTMANYIINEVYKEDGANNLYYHDGKGTYINANLEAGDNSYRYSGANPNNYLCFKEGCTDAEKYRIIGVIDGKVKVIKATFQAAKMPWDTMGKNNWEESSLEAYLNGEYLESLKDIKRLIAPNRWSIGGFNYNILSKRNAKNIYDIEMNYQVSTTKNQKIGLMYASDYLYSVLPEYWSKYAESNDLNEGYITSKGSSWMIYSNYPWTISKISDTTDEVFYVFSAGRIADGHTNGSDSDVFPVFSLIENVKYISGTGTSANPYIIG